MPSKPRTDRDKITTAKSNSAEHEEKSKEKRGRPGGLARAAKLSPARRKEIAKKANAARWKKKDSSK